MATRTVTPTLTSRQVKAAIPVSRTVTSQQDTLKSPSRISPELREIRRKEAEAYEAAKAEFLQDHVEVGDGKYVTKEFWSTLTPSQQKEVLTTGSYTVKTSIPKSEQFQYLIDTGQIPKGSVFMGFSGGQLLYKTPAQLAQEATFKAENIQVGDKWYDRSFWNTLTPSQQAEVKATGQYTVTTQVTIPKEQQFQYMVDQGQIPVGSSFLGFEGDKILYRTPSQQAEYLTYKGEVSNFLNEYVQSIYGVKHYKYLPESLRTSYEKIAENPENYQSKLGSMMGIYNDYSQKMYELNQKQYTPWGILPATTEEIIANPKLTVAAKDILLTGISQGMYAPAMEIPTTVTGLTANQFITPAAKEVLLTGISAGIVQPQEQSTWSKVWQGVTPWKEELGQTVSLKGGALLGAELVIPGVYTARHWTELGRLPLSPLAQTGAIGLDVLTLLPIVGSIGKVGSTATRVSGGFGTRLATAERTGLGFGRDILSFKPIFTGLRHPMKTTGEIFGGLTFAVEHPFATTSGFYNVLTGGVEIFPSNAVISKVGLYASSDVTRPGASPVESLVFKKVSTPTGVRDIAVPSRSNLFAIGFTPDTTGPSINLLKPSSSGPKLLGETAHTYEALDFLRQPSWEAMLEYPSTQAYRARFQFPGTPIIGETLVEPPGPGAVLVPSRLESLESVSPMYFDTLTKGEGWLPDVGWGHGGVFDLPLSGGGSPRIGSGPTQSLQITISPPFPIDSRQIGWGWKLGFSPMGSVVAPVAPTVPSITPFVLPHISPMIKTTVQDRPDTGVNPIISPIPGARPFVLPGGLTFPEVATAQEINESTFVAPHGLTLTNVFSEIEPFTGEFTETVPETLTEPKVSTITPTLTRVGTYWPERFEPPRPGVFEFILPVTEGLEDVSSPHRSKSGRVIDIGGAEMPALYAYFPNPLAPVEEPFNPRPIMGRQRIRVAKRRVKKGFTSAPSYTRL